MRPRSLDEVVGQDELVGENGIDRRLAAGGRMPSLILHGPPGSGKTTVGRLLASTAGAASETDTGSGGATTGGVINAVVHRVMETARLLCVQVDYVGVTRVLSSRSGRLSVASINGTEHVWDLLPRNTQW